MKLKKHQTAKIAKGLYNYRGYNIQLLGPRHWVIYSEDDTVAAQTRTLSGMKRTCDWWEKLAAIEARALSNKTDQQ